MFKKKYFFINSSKYMTETIQEKLSQYIEFNKQLANLRNGLKTLKKQTQDLEKEIKEYMTKNDMDSISLKDGEIVLYSRKISQTFKKETIVEKLTEELKDSEKAERLTQSILENKKFIVEDKIKAVIKKKT
jgi:hypothetical protein